MPRKSISQKISTNTIAQHMTVELEILNQSANHAKDMLMNKVNFFLALVTAIGGGLAYMFTLDKLPNFLIATTCIVIFILILMGINTLRQSLDLSASAITFYRRAGRIRKWYVEREPTLEAYLPFNVADNLPRMSSSFINLRGAESILLLVNSSLIGVSIGLGGIIIFPNVNLIYIIAACLSVFWVSWMLQVKYVKLFMQRWDKRQEKLGLIHFPEKLGTEEDFQRLLK
jgi:hypothetical protein